MTNSPYLQAVIDRIGEAIVLFCLHRVGERFHADDLRAYVTNTVGACAPGSADRILRDLRTRGALDYVVLSRSKSLYRVLWVNAWWGLV